MMRRAAAGVSEALADAGVPRPSPLHDSSLHFLLVHCVAAHVPAGQLTPEQQQRLERGLRAAAAAAQA